MFVSTSVGGWLATDGMFLYLPYFSFVFPVFYFGITATQRLYNEEVDQICCCD